MADYSWKDDERNRYEQERRRWEDNNTRFGRDNRSDNNATRSGDDQRYGGSRYEDQRGRFASSDDFGRESDYGAGYATPRQGFGDLDRRPGGMRDESRDNRGKSPDYRGNYGANASDREGYGDWEGQGSFGSFGGPRFGDNYGRERDAYGRGYRNYGTGNYSGANYGSSSRGRGYAPTGPDYGNGPNEQRNFWDRAGDEVASWAGDRDAARRRDADRASHWGKGPRGYVRSDERIREDVNERLTNDWQLDATNIDVAVNSGEVTLTGTVDTRDGKHHAEHLVENLAGVRHVQNNLRVSQGGSSAQTSTPVGSTNEHTSLSSGQSSTAGGAPQRTGSTNNLSQTH